jgi:hypothetical protein
MHRSINGGNWGESRPAALLIARCLPCPTQRESATQNQVALSQFQSFIALPTSLRRKVSNLAPGAELPDKNAMESRAEEMRFGAKYWVAGARLIRWHQHFRKPVIPGLTRDPAFLAALKAGSRVKPGMTF